MRLMIRFLPIIVVFSMLLGACSKDTEVVPDNDAPYYGEVSDVVIRNYINRMFIDLIGREPFDTEMEAELIVLKQAGLSGAVRELLLTRLQSDTNFIEGDGSYKNAYYNRVYEQNKARFMEAASNSEIDEVKGPIASGIIPDSLNGNWEAVASAHEQVDKLNAVLASEAEYRNGLLSVNEMCARMIDNPVFDQINMNTFNVVNASFDNLFFRFPTDAEFNAGYTMIEYNQPSTIFGQSGQNKFEFARILTSSNAFYEGLIIWTYQTLLARVPSTLETERAMILLVQDRDLQRLQRDIMKTDEYAQFN
jgi:hypothetical protein